MKTLAAKRSMRPPLKMHGGKHRLARKIIALIPPHKTYSEPFIGAGSILLNHRPSEVEILSDIDPNLINFWRSLRDDPTLCQMAALTPYTQQSFDLALQFLDYPDPTIRALAYLVRNRMSRGALGKRFAWSKRLRGGQPGDVNGWETIKPELPLIRERINRTRIVCAPALEVIRENDGDDTFGLYDPPYLPETRTHKTAYAHEMSIADHCDLLDLLGTVKGKFLLCGYHSGLYADAAKRHGWEHVSFEVKNNAGQGKKKQDRTEVVWANYDIGGTA